MTVFSIVRPAPLLVGLCVMALAGASTVYAQNRPNPPVITEPATDNQVLNGADVHMETAPFSDPDPGQGHLCSDWEIWRISPAERVWFAGCVNGILATHIHLGDGTYENSHGGFTALLPDTDYRVRVRHRDTSGNAATEWSFYTERPFRTGPASQVFPLELDDVALSPTPELLEEGVLPFELPASATPASVQLRSADEQLLLEFRGRTALGNQIINPAALSAHSPVRAIVQAGDAAITLPPLDIVASDVTSQSFSVYLPAVTLNAGERADYWVAQNGATYHGHGGNVPDFDHLERGPAVPWRMLAPGFRVQMVASDLQLPTNIAFVPNPGPAPTDVLCYVTELYGSIKTIRRDGSVGTFAGNLLNFNPNGNFPGSGELGVTGVVVDPTNGDVYATMLYSANPPNDGPLYPRVDRFTSTDGGQTAATRTMIRAMPGETMGASHQISSIGIGADGLLYVHVGDGFNTSTGQNINSFRGKVLRMTKAGAAAPGNPLYNAGNGITATDFIFAYGLRNPFGGTFRGSTGQRYFVENGPSVDRFAQLVAGRNYGWDGSNTSMQNFALYNWDPSTAPVNIAFIESMTFARSGFPAVYEDVAFVTESGPTYATGPQMLGKKIRTFRFNPDGSLATGPMPFLEYIGSGKATCVGLAAGPDGLYFTDLYKDLNYVTPIDRGANLLKIVYVGQVDFAGRQRFGCEGPHTVEFTNLSDVPGASAWEWQFGDGGTSTEQNPVHVFAAPGDYNVRLRVTGTSGPVALERAAFVVVGQVEGLLTEIYDTMNLSGPALIRRDANIDYGWGSGSPAPSIGPDTFAVRWTGRIVSPVTAQRRLVTESDDGIRVWLNGNLVINNWTDHGNTIDLAEPFNFTANEPYDLKVEYYENGGGAVCRLFWEGPGQARVAVPASALLAPEVCAPRGDMNCDGVVSVSDIGPFVTALTSREDYEAQFPGCSYWAADLNGNAAVTVTDIGPFVDILSGP